MLSSASTANVVKKAKSVLFIQCTDPAGYPPLINASALLADRGWQVTTLTAPVRGFDLVLPSDPRICVEHIRPRKSHRLQIEDYGRYLFSTAALALRIRPDAIYASDMPSAGPALLARLLSGAKLVYHEHDSPDPGGPKTYLKRMRRIILRKADLLVFPNAKRAEIVGAEHGLDPARVKIAWNMPRRAELPTLSPKDDHPLILYFHGSITPTRLPFTVIDAVRQFAGRIELQIAGYEVPGSPGYLASLLAHARNASGSALAHYVGQIPERAHLLQEAARAHIGLSFMPKNSCDINMRHMAGASNKAFDYMAAGLPLLVSELPDWQEMFVAPAYARACNPGDVNSIAAALRWYLDHPDERQAMGARARVRIETEWNYDTAFAPVAAAIADLCRG